MKETGPEAVPLEDLTIEPLARSRVNEKPVPPPVWWIKACHLTASKIPTKESSTGRTKQAEYWSLLPFRIHQVGEVGKLWATESTLGGFYYLIFVFPHWISAEAISSNPPTHLSRLDNFPSLSLKDIFPKEP
jgi:hypothetical protein